MQGFRDQDSLQVLNDGLREIPNSPLLWYGMGVVNQVSGRYEQAVTTLRKSLTAQHDQPGVWSMLAETYQTLGQYEKAEECYQTAVGLGASPEILAGYAELLVKLRQLSDAERVLEHASAKDREEPNLDRAWGKLYNAEGQYARAQSFLQRATSLEPDDADAHFALATCLQHLGRSAEARQEYALADQRKNTLSESTRLLRRTLVPLEESSGTE
jgi:Flp pilus assembly protein TadD